MKLERRKASKTTLSEPASGGLPVDYLKLVEETMSSALEGGLKLVQKSYPEARFFARGAIFPDEVVMAVTLSQGKQNLSASTIYASADYNPETDKPSLLDTLAACIDSIGGLFEHFLEESAPDRVEQLLQSSMSALEEAPFEWTLVDTVQTHKVVVYVKMDKSNPELDDLAEDWLKKNDPEFQKKSEIKDEGKLNEAEQFLEERLEALKNAGKGSGNIGGGGFTGGGAGPITH
jgi:hypothetical protein